MKFLYTFSLIAGLFAIAGIIASISPDNYQQEVCQCVEDNTSYHINNYELDNLIREYHGEDSGVCLP